MVTHYDPFYNASDDDGYREKAMCGTRVYENYDATGNKNHISCKKCLKQLDNLEAYADHVHNERMAQEADFINSSNYI